MLLKKIDINVIKKDNQDLEKWRMFPELVKIWDLIKRINQPEMINIQEMIENIVMKGIWLLKIDYFKVIDREKI